MEQPDLWGTKPDEQEKHKSVHKFLAEPLPRADRSVGSDRQGQRGAAEEAPGKAEGLVPGGMQPDQARGRSQNRGRSPSTPSLPLAAPPKPQNGSGDTWFWYQPANPSSKLLAGCSVNVSLERGKRIGVLIAL